MNLAMTSCSPDKAQKKPASVMSMAIKIETRKPTSLPSKRFANIRAQPPTDVLTISQTF